MARSLVSVFVFVSALAALPARAQQPGPGGPPVPLTVDLAKVEVGSWSDYTMTMGAMPPMKMRMGLVARGPEGTSLETTVEGGMMASAGKMVMQVRLAPGGEKDGKVAKMIMQLGGGDPMEMPMDPSTQKPFTKPNPKTLVGSETVKVPAGSFKTKHYRDKTPQGDVFDFWVNDAVPPFGLVRMKGEQKKNPQMPGQLTIELNATGKDAKPAITKPAKPFDQAALMQQMMGGRGGPPPGAAPAPGAAHGPPGAAPAPAPAAPAPPAKK
jgi:hypothetical protein